MNSNIRNYLNNLMIPIPGGVEYLRDYRDEQARGCGATCRRRGHPSFGIDDLGFCLAKSF